ncbi:MAG: ABC transporter ATP-binding protein [Dehalococcoidales bacterium]
MNQSQTDTKPLVEAKDLTVTYGGQKVLDVSSIKVNQNEVLGIIGPNGSGKTTLLLCLTRLVTPHTGVVSYHGTPILSRKSVLQLHRRIAVVFQESLLLNNSVWENVVVGLKLRKVKSGEIKTRAGKWLERFGIAALAKRQTRTLSSGESKRTSLARAFALQPEIMFLDEPFTALDGPTRQALLEDFKSVLGETRMTTVIVTHDRNEALALTDRVGVIMGGNIVQLGTPAEVFSTPTNEEIANFIEAGNILHGVVENQNEGLAVVRVSEQQIEVSSDLPAGNRVILLLPYDDVTINLPSSETVTTSARNRFPGEIVKMFPTGSQVRVTIDCGFPLMALITRRSAEEMGLKEGVKVVALIKAVSIHVIARH